MAQVSPHGGISLFKQLQDGGAAYGPGATVETRSDMQKAAATTHMPIPYRDLRHQDPPYESSDDEQKLRGIVTFTCI